SELEFACQSVQQPFLTPRRVVTTSMTSAVQSSATTTKMVCKLLDLENKNREFLQGDTNIFIYLEESAIEQEIEIRIYLKVQCPDSSYCESRRIESQDYEEAYKEYYKPFSIGTFLIVPSWHKDSSQIKNTSSIPLYLNPGLAFGTGHHETTHLMLNRMAQIDLAGKNILDMGAGSGILSIAAGLLGAKNVVSIDIDKNAVSATNANLRENDFENETKFTVLEGSFECEEVLIPNYDLVLANITFAVLSNNIQYLQQIHSKRFLFSGLLKEKEKAVIHLFTKLGGSSEYLNYRNDWLLVDWIRK
ncbi:MAG: 50S ribosomal protein L11 methyltransferase, partial [Spirochaetota bacterium]